MVENGCGTICVYLGLPSLFPSFPLQDLLVPPATTIEPGRWGEGDIPPSRTGEPPEKAMENDAEGVWSPNIEQSFQEALSVYPPCGRRKIILSDEGKMYGHNELIAQYIKLRTGKTRTRKQVSSHIQVLAWRKSREIQSKLKDQVSKDKALQSIAAMSSAQLISATGFQDKSGAPSITHPPFPPSPGVSDKGEGCKVEEVLAGLGITSGQGGVRACPLGFEVPMPPVPSPPVWPGHCIGSPHLCLVEFSAFVELPAEPKTADLSAPLPTEPGAFCGVSSKYKGPEPLAITCAHKVCSFGNQVVERVETELGHLEDGRYVFRLLRFPLCEYLINFVHKLQQLPEKYMMDSVLENFTVLQVVRNRDSQELLLCVAFVFEVSANKPTTMCTGWSRTDAQQNPTPFPTLTMSPQADLSPFPLIIPFCHVSPRQT
uniref:TEA domain transcription factor 2 n=1 Tax=Crocodylus porosus TaxID=8502 RepID=A0A7M4FHG8_CROPO